MKTCTARFTGLLLSSVTSLLCVALLWAAPHRQVHAQAAPSEIHFVADVPLLECDGMPCVEARINSGNPMRFLIDIGDASTVLDTQIAKATGFSLSPASQRNREIFRSAIPSLHIGDLTLSDVSVLTMDIAGFVARNQMPHSAGLLAYSLFKNRALQIDFRRRRLRISDVISTPVELPGTSDSFSLITFGKHGPPIVVANGFSINEREVTAQIDTQYSGSLLIYTASIEKLGLGDEAGAAKGVRDFPFTDGGVKMKFAPAREESFHGIPLATAGAVVYFPTPGVHEPDALFDATVGLPLFRDKILTLDFHNMKVSIAG